MFQSTPVIANGRISRLSRVTTRVRGFNPRPLLLTGESLNQFASTLQPEVSIHARYC